MPKLSLAMIVKNEEKHLAKTLDTVKEIVDEILHGADDARPRLYEIMRNHGIEPEAYLAGDFEKFIARRLEWFDQCLASIARSEA